MSHRSQSMKSIISRDVEGITDLSGPKERPTTIPKNHNRCENEAIQEEDLIE
jgi:hypothetical protein